MEPVEIPMGAQLTYPKSKVIDIGPPEGVAEIDCGRSKTLVGPQEGGVFDGAIVLRTFFQPTPEELESLNNGGSIELFFIANAMPPHGLNVWSAE